MSGSAMLGPAVRLVQPPATKGHDGWVVVSRVIGPRVSATRAFRRLVGSMASVRRAERRRSLLPAQVVPALQLGKVLLSSTDHGFEPFRA